MEGGAVEVKCSGVCDSGDMRRREEKKGGVCFRGKLRGGRRGRRRTSERSSQEGRP